MDWVLFGGGVFMGWFSTIPLIHFFLRHGSQELRLGLWALLVQGLAIGAWGAIGVSPVQLMTVGIGMGIVGMGLMVSCVGFAHTLRNKPREEVKLG